MVSIAYGKGVIGVTQYTGNINGEKYAQIVREKFPDLLEKSANPKGRYFIQDNDPSQNSRAAKEALEDVKAYLFKIPPRSPDINPIENVFHLVSKKIRSDAKNNNITKENFTQFSHRCKKLLLEFPVDIIDKAVASMNKHIEMLIDNHSQRTKY